MTRPYHHGDLKAALLVEAETILKEEGMTALTLRGIARRAAVSPTAPKHHFGDLTGLLSELAARGFDRFAGRLREAIEGSPEAKARAAGRAYVAFARENRALFLLMFTGDRTDQRRPALRAAMEEAFTLLVGTAAEPTDEAGAAGWPLVARATRNWALVHGFAMLLIDRRLPPTSLEMPDLDPDRLLDEVLSD